MKGWCPAPGGSQQPGRPPLPGAPARGGPRIDPHTRAEFASAFRSGGELYHRVRPGYPDEIAEWLLPSHVRTVLDLGSGTGKFTEQLVRADLDVFAVDPSADMLAQLQARLPGVRAQLGSAEATGLESSSVDAVVVAQAWHWFDAEAASAEIARILRPGGTLGVVSNQLDVQQPWVHRLSRIMHAGDVHRPGYEPARGSQFQPWHGRQLRWVQEVYPAELIDLAKSRSYYRRATAHVQQRVLANLHWYL